MAKTMQKRLLKHYSCYLNWLHLVLYLKTNIKITTLFPADDVRIANSLPCLAQTPRTVEILYGEGGAVTLQSQEKKSAIEEA